MSSETPSSESQVGKAVRWAQALGLVTSLGLEFALSTSLFALGGLYIDRLIGWRVGVFTIFLGLVGAATGLFLMIRTLGKFESRTATHQTKDP